MTRSLILATPCVGGMVHAAYASSVFQLASDPGVGLMAVWKAPADLARTRSRIVRKFLQETSATDLLFVDSDISFDPDCVRGLLATGYDVVGAPYPYKRLHWDRVARVVSCDMGPVVFVEPNRPNLTNSLEAAAYDYPYHLSRDTKLDMKACAKVDAIPMGMALLSRAALMMMVEHFAPTLTMHDQGKPTVALFQLMLKDGSLFSEDYSFCRRWTGLGGECHLYCGPGTPVTHHGGYAYRGDRKALLGLTGE